MAARTEILAVTVSRVSPTMMMSGSWRSRARRPLSKVRPAVVFTWVWLIRGTVFSTGSSTVEIFTPRWDRYSSTIYRVVDLPEPVGPVM